MVHIELTVIRNAVLASFADDVPETAKILVDLALIATVTDSDMEFKGFEKGSRVDLRATLNEARQVIEVTESYEAIRSLLAAHSTLVTT